ncbi:MAG: hypothetical protein WC443_09905, partial [Desulfobaccales bacterium]
MSRGPTVIRPQLWERTARLPALGLIPPDSFTPEAGAALKQAEQVPVHLVFPVGSAREAGNLSYLLALVRPLLGRLIDQVWIAFGGERPEGLKRLTETWPQVKVFTVARHLPPDQEQAPLGKGAAMRACLYHLVAAAGVTDPRAVVV